MKSTITLTFGDVAENHVRMEKIGKLAKSGFTIEELINGYARFSGEGYECELVDLKQGLPKDKRDKAEDAVVLVVRGGAKALISDSSLDDLIAEQEALDVDKKAFMYGRVCNKKARYNLCFADYSQEPIYDEGRGRVVNFADIPVTNKIRENLGGYIGKKGEGLMAEGNYYYDISKCGIGYHGDAERKIVVGVRLGEKLPLHYHWFYKNEPVGEAIKFKFGNGDIYFMSDKATGNDWKKKNVLTLRHAAGSAKFLSL